MRERAAQQHTDSKRRLHLHRLLCEFVGEMEGNSDNDKFQLIREDQTFNERGMEAFIRESRELSSCGVDYSVISIIGPQSSGKSTLLNHIFETTFAVMNDEEGRSQTTKGIWMAKYINPCILILDIEGTDGRERGQEDTSFENQSALFSLSVSDIVMINMWYHEIGRVNGAGIPLLELVFRERVRLNLPQRQTTLLVVIRDYNFRTKLEGTRKQIGDMLNGIWTTITQQAGRSNLQFSEYFKYDVVPVPHLQHQADEFCQKAKELRELFSERIVDQSSRIPISGLTMNIKQIWSVIQENEDLNIPSIRIMVSQHMCSQIVKEELQLFQLDESYKNFLNSLDTTSAQEFRVQVENLIDTCMKSYLEKTKHYDENARVEHEQELKSELYEIIQPEHEKMIKRLAVEIFESFKQAAHDIETLNINKPMEIFQQKSAEVTIAGSNWYCAIVQNELFSDVTAHVDLLVANASKLLLSQSKCAEIAKEKFESFKSGEGYGSLLRDIKSGQDGGFTSKVKNLIDSCLQEYSTETSQYDEKFRRSNEEWLNTELYELMNEPYRMLIKRIYQKYWTSFDESLRTTDDLYASVSILNRFEQECAEVASAYSGWKYNRFIQRMKDDMSRRIDETIAQERRKAEEAKRPPPPSPLDIFASISPAGLLVKTVVDAIEGPNNRAGQAAARLEVMENSYNQARSFLFSKLVNLLDDWEADF